jgi:protein O-mannosyl-transferase
MRAGFVWDDVPLVVENTMTGDLSNLPRFFSVDLWATTVGEEGGSGYYRPLMLVSLAVERALYGLWAPGHHLQSVAWHLLAVAGLMRLARPALGSWGALVAGLVFGLHPIQVEAVTWVAARNDPMAAALGLWALDQITWREPTRWRVFGALLLTVLAGLAKESAVLLPAMLLVVDVVGRRRLDWRRYLPLVCGIGCVGALRVAVGVDAAGLPDAVGWTLLGSESHRVVGLMATRLVAPWPLHTGVALEWIDRLPVWRWAVGLSVLPLAFAVAVAAARRGRRQPLVGLAWASLALAPLVIPIADKGLLGERYLYLSVVGIGWAMGAGAGRRRLGLVALLAIPAVVMVQLRVAEWRSDETLWRSALSHLDTPYLHGSVAHILQRNGDAAGALEAFVRALDDPRPDPSSCIHAVQTATALGQAGLAAQVGHWSARKGCSGEAFDGRYGTALALAGDWERADRVASRSDTRIMDERLIVLRTAIARRRGEAGAPIEDALEERVAVLLESAVGGTIATHPSDGRPDRNQESVEP